MAFVIVARWLTVPVLAVVVVVSAGLLLRFPGSADLYVGFWSGFPRVAYGFFLGVLLHAMHAKGWLPRIRVPFVVLCGMLVGCFVDDGARWHVAICWFVVFPLIVVVGAQCVLSGAMLRVAALGGALSYPLYVMHAPLLYMLEGFGRSRDWLLVDCLVIVAASFVVLKLYDEPVRRALTEVRHRIAPET